MTEFDISNATRTDLASDQDDFSVTQLETDGPLDQKETKWYNKEWAQQFAYYKKIPELRADIDALSRWTVGKGITTDPTNRFFLDSMKGFGKDSFNTIIENQDRVATIGGDSFAEIVMNDEIGPVNLKPLNPGNIQIVANRQGIIIRYEQINRPSASWMKRTWGNVTGKGSVFKFKPEQIFHLTRNRIADEIHGTSLIEAVEEVILMRNEILSDHRIMLHRNVVPVRIIEVDSDNTTKLAGLKTQWTEAIKKGEVIIVPMGTVKVNEGGLPPNSTINPLPILEKLNAWFHQTTGVPQIITGNSGEITGDAAKILYMCFQQTILERQLYLKEQIGLQLGMEINLEMPASIQNDMISDAKKDGPVNIDQSDVTPTMGQGV